MSTSVHTNGKQSSRSTGPVDCIGTDGVLERPRYFPRQLITPDVLTLEATYFRKRLRLHNRHLHGWGVVCGAAVCRVEDPDGDGALARHVKITPGYVLGPYGDDILIDCEHIVDLRTGGAIRILGRHYDEAYDPWCTEVIADDLPETVFIAVRYKEIKARQVRTQPAGCGCDDTPCEYSRWQDGYEVGILTDCPPDQLDEPSSVSGRSVDCPPIAAREENDGEPGWPPCMPCPTSAWVVLAKVDIGADGSIVDVDNRECRRIVTCSAYFCPDDFPDEVVEEPSREFDSARREFYSQLEVLRNQLREVEEKLQVQDPSSLATSHVSEFSIEEGEELRERFGDEALVTAKERDKIDWSARDVGAKVLDLPATAIHGLGEDSTPGKWLKEKNSSIRDLTGMSYSEIRPSGAEVPKGDPAEGRYRDAVLKASRIAFLVSQYYGRG